MIDLLIAIAEVERNLLGLTETADEPLKSAVRGQLALLTVAADVAAEEAATELMSHRTDMGGDERGWYDSCAMTSNMQLGDWLVEHAGWERRPEGFGRRWFYRPPAIKPAPTAPPTETTGPTHPA